jgi:acyl-coenzyme A synthetase/AMP-(fatty) acid ligase
MTFNNKLEELLPYLYSTPSYTLAIKHDKNVSSKQFLMDIALTKNNIDQHPTKKNWALYSKDTYNFAVGLFALLESKKNIIIPGNNTEATETHITPYIDARLGELKSQTTELISHSNNAFTPARLERTYNSSITIFTSGSSGQPKAITKQLCQFEAELTSLEECWGEKLSNCKIVATVSHQHIYGLLFKLLWPLTARRPFYSEQILDFAHIFNLAEEEQLDLAWIASPAHLKRLNESFSWEAAKRHWKMIFSSGGPLPRDVAEKITGWLNDTPFEVYGSSETGGIAWRQQNSEHSAWKNLPGVDIKTDNDNRLYVKSAHISDSGEWFRTDDGINIDEEGFHLTGRLDRIIKLEEKRLSLVELEAAITDHPYAQESYTIVIPPTEGRIRETLAAINVLTPSGTEILKNEGRSTLVKALKSHLQKYFELSLIPRKWRFVSQIPTNEQSKIDKAAILNIIENE